MERWELSRGQGTQSVSHPVLYQACPSDLHKPPPTPPPTLLCLTLPLGESVSGRQFGPFLAVKRPAVGGREVCVHAHVTVSGVGHDVCLCRTLVLFGLTPVCNCAPCRLDPCCSHLSGLHGIWRKLPPQPQYWHAAQVSSSHRCTRDLEFGFCFLLQLFLQFLNCFYVARRCYEMERRLKTPDLFKFPYFEAICWYVAKNLLETLKGKSKT